MGLLVEVGPTQCFISKRTIPGIDVNLQFFVKISLWSQLID
jgi:hypothetical protein